MVVYDKSMILSDSYLVRSTYITYCYKKTNNQDIKMNQYNMYQ